MAYNKTEKPDFPAKRKGGIRRRKKVCVFCGKDNLIDYKDVNKLKRYVSERGKTCGIDALCSGLSSTVFDKRIYKLIALKAERIVAPLFLYDVKKRGNETTY